MPSPGGIIPDRLRHPHTPRNHRHSISQTSDAHRRIKLNAVTTAGAQCFPRHACPLHGALLMQLQLYLHSTAGGLVRGFWCDLENMQIHARR